MQGNAELLSISSNDSIWNSDDEIDPGKFFIGHYNNRPYSFNVMSPFYNAIHNLLQMNLKFIKRIFSQALEMDLT